MKPFLYCPSCAARLPERDAEGASSCSSCGRTWYRNAAPTVGAAIVDGGRVLVTRRARDPFAGKCDVPGGFLHHFEDPLTGLRREVSEELGVAIDVGPDGFVQAVPHTYGDEDDWVLAMGFRARLVSGEPQPADDVADVTWATEKDIDELDFAWEHDRELLRKALADERSGT